MTTVWKLSEFETYPDASGNAQIALVKKEYFWTIDECKKSLRQIVNWMVHIKADPKEGLLQEIEDWSGEHCLTLSSQMYRDTDFPHECVTVECL